MEAIRKPVMTRAEFFEWAQARDEPYEFDGFQPVAMTGGTIGYHMICKNIVSFLDQRLEGSGCTILGEAGLATQRDAVRYPDAMVVCGAIDPARHTVDNPVIVFEVLSPSSGRVDRVTKLREYAAVPSIRRYVIVESTGVGLTLYVRTEKRSDWTATALTAEDALSLPEIGIEIPVADLYRGLDFEGAA